MSHLRALFTTVGALGILAPSVILPLSQFRYITAMTIVFSFIASVFILPSALMLWTKHSKWEKKKYLFNLSRTKYMGYMNEGTINPKLKKAFENEDYNLEDDEKLSKLNGKWLVSENGDKEYMIGAGDEKLYIYKKKH